MGRVCRPAPGGTGFTPLWSEMGLSALVMLWFLAPATTNLLFSTQSASLTTANVSSLIVSKSSVKPLEPHRVIYREKKDSDGHLANPNPALEEWKQKPWKYKQFSKISQVALTNVAISDSVRHPSLTRHGLTIFQAAGLSADETRGKKYLKSLHSRRWGLETQLLNSPSFLPLEQLRTAGYLHT